MHVSYIYATCDKINNLDQKHRSHASQSVTKFRDRRHFWEIKKIWTHNYWKLTLNQFGKTTRIVYLWVYDSKKAPTPIQRFPHLSYFIVFWLALCLVFGFFRAIILTQTDYKQTNTYKPRENTHCDWPLRCLIRLFSQDYCYVPNYIALS